MLRTIRKKTLKILGTSGIVLGSIEIATNLPSEGRSSKVYHDISDNVVTPLLRRFLQPEDAHNAAVYFTGKGFAPKHRPNIMESTRAISLESQMKMQMTRTSTSTSPTQSLIFPSCIGLAAGFDKDGVAIQGLMDLGFGFVEIGSVTPKPQPGNPKPRSFRLLEDEGLINRFGFNSIGMDAVEHNLKLFRDNENVNGIGKPSSQDGNENNLDILHKIQKLAAKAGRVSWNAIFTPIVSSEKSILGVNLGKNKTSTHETEDYEVGIDKLGAYADYLVINISSPNTPGLRNLQQNEPIRRLLRAAISRRDALADKKELFNNSNSLPPLFVKIAPDLSDQELKDIAAAVVDTKVDGVLVSNTSNQRPNSLISDNSKETGGLSGLPIRDMSTECIRKMYALTGGNVFIVGIGGVGSGRDAYEKLKAGASVVQIYSRMVYEGPGVISRIRKELADLMVENGQKCVADVVGLDHEELYWAKRMERIEKDRSKENVIVDL